MGRKKKSTSVSWKDVVVGALLKKGGHKCAICEEPFTSTAPPEIDHIIPVSKGGIDEISNLQLVHHICNVHKGDKEDHLPFQREKLLTIRLIDDSTLNGKLELYRLLIMRQALFDEGNVSAAARKLRVSRSVFRHYLQKWNLKRNPRQWQVKGLSPKPEDHQETIYWQQKKGKSYKKILQGLEIEYDGEKES